MKESNKISGEDFASISAVTGHLLRSSGITEDSSLEIPTITPIITPIEEEEVTEEVTRTEEGISMMAGVVSTATILPGFVFEGQPPSETNRS